VTDVAVRVGLARALLEPCLLCGARPAEVAGVFVPSEQQRPDFRVPESKMRFFFYGLCEPCFARPDQAEAAEVEIQTRLEGGRG
jgi:hypothetical protein